VNPGELLAYMGEACSGLVLVQTCVLRGQGRRIELVEETPEDYTQSSTGRGCRPTRRWVFEELGRFFPFVYLTRTQPNHPEFPVDWSSLDHAPPLVRSVFVASKQPLSLPTLSPELLDLQERLDPKTYIAELELMLAARLKTLQEREQLIRRLHDEAAVLRSAAADRLREMQRKDVALKELKEALERRAAKLERVAEERLQALQAATREAELLRHEAERRELGLRELTAALQERDRRLAELQRPREEAAPTPPSS
jgi:DNA repair exonuclease SbcCD nuclease subunit